jgi:hypothetical protein
LNVTAATVGRRTALITVPKSDPPTLADTIKATRRTVANSRELIERSREVSKHLYEKPQRIEFPPRETGLDKKVDAVLSQRARRKAPPAGESGSGSV